MDLREYVFDKNQNIYNQKDETNCFYFIRQGTVEIYTVRKYGEVIEKTLGVGDVFGYEEYFAGCIRSKRAVAIEKTSVIGLNKENLLDFVAMMPSQGPKIKKQLMGIQESTESNSPLDPLEVKFDNKHQDYLFPKEVECPICKGKFKVNQIRYATLMLRKLQEDFRCVYYDFDDLWYQIWRCPYCDYLNFYDKFYDLDIKIEKMLQESLPRQKPQQIVHIKENYNQVLKDYYDLIRLTEVYKMKPMTKARAWQSLAWILEDLQDLKNVEIQYEKLISTLIEAWHDTSRLQTDIELKLAYKVALLHEKNGDLETAIKFLYKANDTVDAKLVLKKRVNDKLGDLREKYKAMKRSQQNSN